MSKGVHNIMFYVSPDPECSRTTQNSEISLAPSRGHILYAIYGNSTCVINHIVVTAIDKMYCNYYVSTHFPPLIPVPMAATLTLHVYTDSSSLHGKVGYLLTQCMNHIHDLSEFNGNVFGAIQYMPVDRTIPIHRPPLEFMPTHLMVHNVTDQISKVACR